MGHLSALLKKNWIIWKKGGVCSLLEIIFPVAFILLLFIFRKQAKQKDIPEQSFFEIDFKTYENYPYPARINPDSEPFEYNFQGIQQEFYTPIKQCNPDPESTENEERLGFVALAPINTYTQQLSIMLENEYEYQTKFFENEKAILDYAQEDDYKQDICFGISFSEAGKNNKWNYNLHFNVSSWDLDEEIPDTQNQFKYDFSQEELDFHLSKWLHSGFLGIQNWIDNLILKEQTNNQDSEIIPWITSKRIPKYVDDSLPSDLKNNLGTFLVLPQIIVFLRMAYAMVEEKEKKIKESMKIMGLSDSAFYLSWIIHYGTIYLIIAILGSIFVSLTIYPSTNFLIILIWYILFCINLMVQSLMITTFFSRAKIGNVFGMVVFFSLYIVSMVIGNNKDLGTGIRTILAFFPQINTSLSADVFLMSETTKIGIQFSSISKEINKFSILLSIIMYIVSIFTHAIIGIYCDLVIPGEFGAKKHPLFCFPFLFKKKENQESQFQQEQDILQKQEIQKENVEGIDAALKEQVANNDILCLENLTKIYSNGKKAVDDLSFTMYKDQISCLLGHNGSGKTSTISMLTGMQNISKGKATVFGYDVQTQISELRKIMGVCPQHDILYPNLTVREHLELFAQFKGMTDKTKINEEIEQLLIDVDLKFKENSPTKTLSGGQKRRVSIAIAFIGGSKLVYLDEPTSGCDTSVRRSIWDMLRKYKNDRIIVLTTHFMDEADYLGDRITIIGAGQLICSGSPVYLKQKFGVGYNLTIVKKETITPSQPIIDTIIQQISDAKKVSDVSAELAFQLKIDTVSKFQGLFDILDKQKEQLQISNYGISITTMEEVFIKVAHQNVDNKSLLMSKTIDQKQIQQQQNEIEVDNFDLNTIRETNPFSIFLIHFYALIVKRLRYFKRDLKGLFCEMILPCILIVLGLWAMTIQTFGKSPKVELEGGYILETLKGSKMQTLYGGSSDISSSTLDSIAGNFPQKYYDLEYTDLNSISSFDQANFDKYQKDKEDTNRYGAYYFEYIEEGTYKYYEYQLQVDTLLRDSAPLFLNEMNESLIKRATGQSSVEVIVNIAPLPYTKKFLSYEGADKGIQAAFTFAMILSFIPASIIVFIVREREEQVKHQQIVSGISLQAYWISNLVVDIAKYYIPVAIFSILMFLAFNIKTYTKDAAVYSAVILLFLLYGIAIVPFTYLTSFAFKKYGNAQVLTFFVHYIMGGVAPLIVWLLDLLVKSARPYTDILEYVFKIFPSFCFGYGMINLGSIETFYQVHNLKKKQSAYDMKIAGGDILFLALTSVFYFILIFVIEYFQQKGALNKLISTSKGCPQYMEKIYDNDVQDEINTIEKSNFNDYVVRVNKLRKVFKVNGVYNQAVDRVSFGIKYGECFTLLGVNGAGKTTIFKILSGDLHATSGTANIKGYDVTKDMASARYHIGYCPQFDSLLENLTTREHLELYAAIKGIPSKKRKTLIDKKIKEMELSDFENVCAGTYSGGNKRKLSVAVAMIGNPPIVFLDEPSTGMDPVARRYMWDVISRITTLRKQSSVILTTHSMEEAEALSTRMAIQVAGQLKCIGPIQHIKSKFGGGYEVEVKLQIPEEQEINNLIQQQGFLVDLLIDIINFQQVIEKLQFSHLKPLIAPGNIGEDLLNKMKGPKRLPIHNLVEFCITETRTQQLHLFIGNSFGQYKIIEHFSTYSRYKIQTEIPTGKIFGTFENNKKQLSIASYSVKQATIESIFNEFATGKINTLEINKQQNQNKVIQQNVKQIQPQQQINQEIELINQQNNNQNQHLEGQQVKIKSGSIN